MEAAAEVPSPESRWASARNPCFLFYASWRRNTALERVSSMELVFLHLSVGIWPAEASVDKTCFAEMVGSTIIFLVTSFLCRIALDHLLCFAWLNSSENLGIE